MKKRTVREILGTYFEPLAWLAGVVRPGDDGEAGRGDRRPDDAVEKATAAAQEAAKAAREARQAAQDARSWANRKLNRDAAERSFGVGEALVGGDDNEVAHIDLILGPKTGPVGDAFANTLSRQTEGHNSLLVVVKPNMPVKPDTVMFNKVTIEGGKQAIQMFGPAQAAVGRAVVDSVEDGTIPRGDVDDLAVVVGVFIHGEAEDNQKIFDYNYEATKLAIERAVAGKPSYEDLAQFMEKIREPWAGDSELPWSP